MAERLEHPPGKLSGGQQQRVSIARALINGAEVILADEPTGALDQQTGEEVLRLLGELHAEGKTVIIVTHDASVAARAERVIEISDGSIVADRRNPDAGPVGRIAVPGRTQQRNRRSEEHTSELQSLMRISYAVFCLKK